MAILKKLIDALKRRFSFRKKKKHTRKVKTRRIIRRKVTRVKKAKPRRFFQKTRSVKKPKKPQKPRKKKFRVTKSPKKILPSRRPAVPVKENPPIGEITHYFSRIGVCVVKINSGTIAVGDKLQIKGATTKFIQLVRSLQIESVDVKIAHKGDLVGLKADKKARAGDLVYKVLA